MPILFAIERSGTRFNATADGGTPFLVGFQTHYTDKSSGQSFEGLFNVPTTGLPKLLYQPGDIRAQYGFWADFIAPTAACEGGGNYLTLNTYDRAAFTWGFTQFGAHVPNGDFVLFFRDMLGRPEAADYFPDLTVTGGRISRLSGGALESDISTAPLMSYLNPSTAHVEDAEVLAGAKLIHWTTNHADARGLQAMHMVGIFKQHMKAADIHVGLDGRTADIGCVVCDILHQGRAKYTAIQQALAAAKPLDALLLLGATAYKERVATLRKALAAAGATFTSKTWSRANGDFH